MPRAVVGLPEPALQISASLSNSFRFGKPTADGIEAVVEFVGSPYRIRDALIVNPRPGQANSGIRALASAPAGPLLPHVASRRRLG